jgi:drug/metabolite transporter (DMT)-like permease
MTSDPEPSHPLAPSATFAGLCLIWGSTFLVIRIGNDTVPPLWAATLRLGLASLLLLALVGLTRQRLPRGPALSAAAGFGFLNFGLSFCFLYWGEKTVPSGLAAVLYGTAPLSTALFARVAGLERLRALKIAGALVALAGVATIFSGQLTARVSGLPIAAIFTAATLGSASGVVLKRGPHQHPLGANAVGAMVGLAVCAAASFLAREPHPLPTTSRAILPILYLATVGSVVAFGLYVWLVNHWAVTRISFVAVVVPVVAVLLGAAVRHERLTAAHSAGALLVLAGVVLGMVSDRRRPAAAPAATLAAAREA